MNAATRTLGTLLGLALGTLLAATPAPAQFEPLGVVTRLDGTATLARLASPDAMPLRMRDPLFVADRITTGDQSLARLLLGGKALVTVRERSTLTITESAGTSTIDVGLGQMAIAVVKERMKRGETVEIRTPNAVAAIRGTVVIAEVSRAAQPGAFTTTITVLRGLIEFRQIDALTRNTVGAPLNVAGLQSIRVTGNVPARSVQRISPDQAAGLAAQYKVSIKEPAIAAPTAPPTTRSTPAPSVSPAPVAPTPTDSAPSVPAGTGTTGASARAVAPQVFAPAAAAAPNAAPVTTGSDDRPGKSNHRGKK